MRDKTSGVGKKALR